MERPGYTPSERAVRRKFDEVFARTEQRLFISCFSSSIHRIKLAIEMAMEHGRKVALVGRSMNESTEIAQDLGYIDVPDGLLIHPGDIKKYAPERVCVMISGTQGEPMSALSRAAVDNHKHAQDRTRRHGGAVVAHHSRQRKGHLSHDRPSVPPRSSCHLRRWLESSGARQRTRRQEELKLVINLVKPRYFIPIHGEYRQLKRHAELAQSMHGAVGQVLMIESGDVLEFDELGARKAGKVAVGRRCIDSNSQGDVVEELIIRDRRHISEDGIVLPIIAINKLTGRVETPPEIVTRGFAAIGENGFLDEARNVVVNTLELSSAEEKADYGLIKEKIRQDLKRYIAKNTSRRPLIMPVILEI